MIRHVVLISWVPEVTTEQVRRVQTELTALKPLIDGLRDYQIGPDAGLVDGNADFAIVADFDDQASYLGYRNHPSHRKVIEEAINPIARQRVAVQYRLGD
jgi:Stress responsive A/B Barrel Domain